LSFTNQKGDLVELQAPISKDLEASLKQMRKWASL